MFKTLSEFKAAYKATGMHFFDHKTMRFFNTKIESGLLKWKYFITSESKSRDGKRYFKLREINPDLSISIVGEFNTCTTKEQAKAMIPN